MLKSPLSGQKRCFAFATTIGWVGIELHSNGQRDQIVHIAIGYNSKQSLAKHRNFAFQPFSDPQSQDLILIEKIRDYSHGLPVDFEDLELNWGNLTQFQTKVLKQCRRIPYGMTLTYSDLARQVGSPRAYRAVGSAMASNPFPLVVPCHRVVAVNGRLGGFSAPQGIGLKKRLLDLEQRSNQPIAARLPSGQVQVHC